MLFYVILYIFFFQKLHAYSNVYIYCMYQDEGV